MDPDTRVFQERSRALHILVRRYSMLCHNAPPNFREQLCQTNTNIQEIPDSTAEALRASEGPGARPIKAAWVRDIRGQCRRERVPFFFKQWRGVQKKKGGRILDGKTGDGMPKGAPTGTRSAVRSASRSVQYGFATATVLALFTVGDAYASRCKRGAYASSAGQRRSRAPCLAGMRWNALSANIVFIICVRGITRVSAIVC